MSAKPATPARSPKERAIYAMHAAANIETWGLHAAIRYCQRRDVPISLFTVARQLRAVDRAGFDVSRETYADEATQ